MDLGILLVRDCSSAHTAGSEPLKLEAGDGRYDATLIPDELIHTTSWVSAKLKEEANTIPAIKDTADHVTPVFRHFGLAIDRLYESGYQGPRWSFVH